MKRMIILAGGEATRLGPLAAQTNKLLVSIKQRPMIAHHVAHAVQQGVDEIVIVSSRESVKLIGRVLERMNCPIRWRITVQTTPLGPVDALMHGVALADRGSSGDYDATLVMMADTYIGEMMPNTPAWIGIAETMDTMRPWCVAMGSSYEDFSPGGFKAKVFIGALESTIRELRLATNHVVHKHGNGVGMAPLLNYLDSSHDHHRMFTTWHDTGDIGALAETRRQTFTSRDHHVLTLDDRGIVFKQGTSVEDSSAVQQLSNLLLGPRWIGYDSRGTQMEFCEMPSLAELYLYWPGRPDMWAHILRTVMQRLSRDMWNVKSNLHPVSSAAQEGMYITKPNERLIQAGEEHMPGEFIDFLRHHVIQDRIVGSMIHGDLNFGNILYGLGTDTFKLIDPRPRWGMAFMQGDIRYELAKLRYSYRDGFNAITHGLEVDRRDEADAMDEVLKCDTPDLRSIAAIEATLFYSAVPLHCEAERPALLKAADRLVTEVLG